MVSAQKCKKLKILITWYFSFLLLLLCSFSISTIRICLNYAPTAGGGGFPKSTYKPALPSTAIVKGRLSSSPLPSPPEQSGAPASPFGTGSITKHHVSTEEYIPTQMKNKENAASSENEIPARATSSLWETTGRKGNMGAKPMDLQSMLVNLLIQNPKGMSLKVRGRYFYLKYFSLNIWFHICYMLLLRFVPCFLVLRCFSAMRSLLVSLVLVNFL